LWDNTCRKEGQTRKGRQGELPHDFSHGHGLLKPSISSLNVKLHSSFPLTDLITFCFRNALPC
jgi:hypothetical protein